VATPSGDSKWISGEASRALVHEWRAEVDAIAVGIGTALADDPLLTARGPDPVRQPARVVFDSRARLPLDSALVRSTDQAPLLVIAAPEAPDERAGRLREAGAEVVVVGGSPRDCVGSALAELARRDITSVMLEGGPTLAGSFFGAGEVDELRLFFAPRLLGGGRSLVEGAGPERIADADRALSVDWERVGEDLLLRARLREW
jgi:diaminohydroxyphosphoribosylaminopyrimidine deaminase/5-amino-6-(5-phosphoribosylamino)uracil reductase